MSTLPIPEVNLTAEIIMRDEDEFRSHSVKKANGSFAIMRCKKIKTGGSVRSALQHCYRERQTDNADATKLAENVHLTDAESVDDAIRMMNDRLPEKRRKDAVLLVEYMMTASPDWWQSASETDRDTFFKDSLNWLKDKYGAENVVVATVHNDETTPHLSAFVTPITSDGRLSAKEFIGNKLMMTKDQTSYAEKVAHLGLKRGVKGSKAKHQTIRQYYEKLHESLDFKGFTAQDVKPRKTGFFKIETFDGVADRLNKQVQNLSVKASNLENMEKLSEKHATHAGELEVRLKQSNIAFMKQSRDLAKLRKELDRKNSLYDDFSMEQRLEFLKLHEKFTRENKEKEKALKAPKSRGFKI